MLHVMRLRSQWLMVLLLIPGVARILPAATSPYVFAPSGIGIDDSVALRNALITYRWVQIHGSDIQIDQPIDLDDANGNPLDGLVLEPTASFTKVTVHTKMTRNPKNCGDTSRAPFTFEGQYTPGSYLTSAANVGDRAILVQDPASIAHTTFQVGDYIYINDTQICIPPAGSPSCPSLGPADGTAELRQVTAMSNGAQQQTLHLSLDRPLRRAHSPYIIVAHCKVIKNVIFRNLGFTTDYDPSAPSVGPFAPIHLHLALNAQLIRITTRNWAGLGGPWLDGGGRENIIRSSFSTGLATISQPPPGTPCAPILNAWGIATEGQEDTSIIDSGASYFNAGVVITYSYGTKAFNSTVSFARSDGLAVVHDFKGFPSINSGFVGGTVYGGGLGVYVGICQGCTVSVDIQGAYSGIAVAGSYNGHTTAGTTLAGSVVGPTSYGIGLAQDASGAIPSTGTSINTLTACGVRNRFVTLNSSYVPVAPLSTGQTASYATGSIFTNLCL